jgi:hypothetical protein
MLLPSAVLCYKIIILNFCLHADVSFTVSGYANHGLDSQATNSEVAAILVPGTYFDLNENCLLIVRYL